MTYNLTLVLRSSLKEGDREKLIEKIKGSFEKAKTTEKDWGQKVLSYPIKKEVSGYFISMVIESEEVVSADFEKKLLNNDDVLRYLFIKTKVKGQKLKDKK
jgi:ribosomal protein S6